MIAYEVAEGVLLNVAGGAIKAGKLPKMIAALEKLPGVDPAKLGQLAKAAGAGIGDALKQGKHDGKIDAVREIPITPTVVKDSLGRIKSSRVTITIDNLYGGTNTTNAARNLTRPDDAGHIIGKLLGGKGGARSDNIFAQLPGINRGSFAKHEQWVASQLRTGKHVEVEVQLIYKGNSTRPVRIKYTTIIGGIKKTVTFGN